MEKEKLTNSRRIVWILEEKHEQPNSPNIKPLIPRRKGLLQLILINKSTPVLIHHLKAPNHIWVCPWWKTRVPIWITTASLAAIPSHIRLLLLHVVTWTRNIVCVVLLPIRRRQRWCRGCIGLRWWISSVEGRHWWSFEEN